jgi:hypothetical protein
MPATPVSAEEGFSPDHPLYEDFLEMLDPSPVARAAVDHHKAALTRVKENPHEPARYTLPDLGDEESEVEKIISGLESDREKTIVALHEGLEETASGLEDAVAAGFRESLGRAVSLGLKEWDTGEWFELFSEMGQVRRDKVFREEEWFRAQAGVAGPYWRALFEKADPDQIYARTAFHDKVGDWGVVFYFLNTQAQNASIATPSGQRLLKWLNHWSEGAETYPWADPHHPTPTPCLSPHFDKLADHRPGQWKAAEHLELARLRGMEKPDSALGAWASTRAPRPTPGPEFAWNHLIESLLYPSQAKRKPDAWLAEVRSLAQTPEWQAWIFADRPVQGPLERDPKDPNHLIALRTWAGSPDGLSFASLEAVFLAHPDWMNVPGLVRSELHRDHVLSQASTLAQAMAPSPSSPANPAARSRPGLRRG